MKTLYYMLIAMLFSYATLQAQEWQANRNKIYNNDVIHMDTEADIPKINLYLKNSMRIPVIPAILYDPDPGNYNILTLQAPGTEGFIFRYRKHNIMSGICTSNEPEYKVNNFNSKLFKIPNTKDAGINVSLISEHKLDIVPTVILVKINCLGKSI